ncbi:UPF0406 protein CG16790, partial [Camponotus floridanus]
EEVIDNPSDHDGRIRSFKHERGNWATLVYIDCKYFISYIYIYNFQNHSAIIKYSNILIYYN